MQAEAKPGSMVPFLSRSLVTWVCRRAGQQTGCRHEV